MNDTKRRARARTAPLEAGVAPTEQVTGDAASDEPQQLHPAPETDAGEPTPLAPVDEPAPSWNQQAVLTGPEQAELRSRNDTIDWANKRADELMEEAVKMRRLASGAQSDLTNFLRSLHAKYQMDPNLNYHADIERGILVSTAAAPPRR